MTPVESAADDRVSLGEAPLSIERAFAAVARSDAGAVDVFVGIVRDHSEGRVVSSLEYSAYEPMARKELARIVLEVEAKVPGARCAVHHRLGSLHVGELAVVCAASTPHRAESFDACRALIDEVKHRVPIWKRERGPDGESWVGWVDARCGLVGHAHAHGAPVLPLLGAVYRFEEIGDELDLVPLAGRRALDAVGLKVGLAAWRAMPVGARAAIVAAGATEGVDPGRVRARLDGVETAPVEAVAEPDASAVPDALTRFSLDDARWSRLRALDRWALASLARRGKDSAVLALLAELP